MEPQRRAKDPYDPDTLISAEASVVVQVVQPGNCLIFALNKPLLYKITKGSERCSFVPMVHRDVRLVPVHDHAQLLKLFPLDVDPPLRIFPTCFFDSKRCQIFLLLRNLKFDREPVAVPSRNNRHVVPCHTVGFRDNVF